MDNLNSMKTLIFLLSASFVITSGTLNAQVTSKKEFLKLEQKWTDALVQKDSLLLSKLLHPKFTLIGTGATADAPVIDRSLYLRNSMLRSWPRRDVRILEVKLHDNTAVVRCVWQGTEPPPLDLPPPKGGVFKFILTDTWVLVNNRWQVLARHSSFGYAVR
ncbi:MAG: nuclear transport factor 2 family protein [Balneolaceae bacterium]|nr:nuclear transport factor 2 family protein [Balneolaceae bacterium]